MRTRLIAPLFAFALLLAAAAPDDGVAQQEISVNLLFATDIVDREPVGVAETFPADVGKVYTWMRVTGATDQAIQVVWSYGPHEWIVPLEIGGPSWRTWSSKIILPAWTGEWSVDVQDSQGHSITTDTFTIEGT